MIYLIPHGHVIVSFLNRIIIVSRGGLPFCHFFQVSGSSLPDTLWGVGETDQINLQAEVTKSENRLADATFFQDREA
jgi:hypothetical protein